MKRNCLVLIFLFMLLLTAGAFAQSGDVTIKFNDANQVWFGTQNTMEIWVTNSNDIMGLSLGFEFTSSIPGFTWQAGYGNKPSGTKYVQEYGDFVGGMDNALKFTSSAIAVPPLFPLRFLIGGAATPVDPDGGYPIPPHAASTKAWDLKLNMPAGPSDDYVGSFCVKPSFVEPAGSWKMDFGTVIGFVMPTFDGLSTGTDPFAPVIAPAGGGSCVSYELLKRPCLGPAITGPGPQVLSSHSGYSFTFTKTDGEVPPSTWTPAPSVGSITSGGVYTLTPSPANQFCPPLATDVVVHASNACPTTTNYPFTITWTNAAPDIVCPAAVSIPMASTLNQAFVATDVDPSDVASLVWTATAVGATGLFSFTGNMFTYSPATQGTATFTITATDVCGATDVCTFVVTAVPIRFNVVQIAKMGEQYGVGGTGPSDLGPDPGYVYQGTYVWVPVRMGLTTMRLAGFNLLIHYDASALSFVSAKIGPTLDACADGGAGWEYFTYRFGADGNCGGSCPSGLLRVVALAETNNGPNHPGCAVPGPYVDPYDLSGDILTYLKFYVTNDRNFQCTYTEIGFAWIDCGDNSFSDTTGNLLYIAGDSAVHTFEWDKYTLNQNLIACEAYPNMIGVLYGGFCLGECANYLPNKPDPIENMFFMNGGVDVACADSIDARGDINLNGVANEIADAVLFTNYFLKGINAFDPNPQRRQGMIAATDVNADGHALTVGDLVYLLRIIVGDALPFPKLSPFAGAATVNFANGSVSTASAGEIGGVYATFAVNGSYTVSSNTNMQVETSEVNGELKVLVYSGLTNLSNRIASGTNELFTVNGDVELKSVEVADYYGNMLNTRVNKVSMPTSFALSQNVPNPFNPTTKLGFALPNQTDWTLNIYNVAGQLVKSFSGNNIGNVSVEWDASMAPSGVYFYKLNAGSYSDTKKMVLMK